LAGADAFHVGMPDELVALLETDDVGGIGVRRVEQKKENLARVLGVKGEVDAVGRQGRAERIVRAPRDLPGGPVLEVVGHYRPFTINSCRANARGGVRQRLPQPFAAAAMPLPPGGCATARKVWITERESQPTLSTYDEVAERLKAAVCKTSFRGWASSRSMAGVAPLTCLNQ
jgi:hypothetical protein